MAQSYKSFKDAYKAMYGESKGLTKTDEHKDVPKTIKSSITNQPVQEVNKDTQDKTSNTHKPKISIHFKASSFEPKSKLSSGKYGKKSSKKSAPKTAVPLSKNGSMRATVDSPENIRANSTEPVGTIKTKVVFLYDYITHNSCPGCQGKLVPRRLFFNKSRVRNDDVYIPGSCYAEGFYCYNCKQSFMEYDPAIMDGLLKMRAKVVYMESFLKYSKLSSRYAPTAKTFNQYILDVREAELYVRRVKKDVAGASTQSVSSPRTPKQQSTTSQQKKEIIRVQHHVKSDVKPVFAKPMYNRPSTSPDLSEGVGVPEIVLQEKDIVITGKLKNLDGGNVYDFAITNDHFKADSNKRIYHYSNTTALKILTALVRPELNRVAVFPRSSFEVVEPAKLHLGERDDINGLGVLTHEIEIRKNGGYAYYFDRDEAGNDIYDVLLYSPYEKSLVVERVSYDAKAKSYYIDATRLRSFINKYGNPGVTFRTGTYSNDPFESLGAESILHAFGYNVSQNHDLSDATRHAIMRDVVDLKLMTIKEIVRLLQYNINIRPQDRYSNARKLWESDIDYIQNYKANPNRFIIGQIKR